MERSPRTQRALQCRRELAGSVAVRALVHPEVESLKPPLQHWEIQQQLRILRMSISHQFLVIQMPNRIARELAWRCFEGQ